jgi:transcriptional regulator with XRE-family HTH domain
MRKGLSQEEVARLMREAGFSWRQTTAAKTEASDRPVRVNEAAALASILGTSLAELTGQHDMEHSRLVTRVESAEAELRKLAAITRRQTAAAESAQHDEEVAHARLQYLRQLLEFSKEHDDEALAAGARGALLLGEDVDVLAEAGVPADIVEAAQRIATDHQGQGFTREQWVDAVVSYVLQQYSGGGDGEHQASS